MAPGTWPHNAEINLDLAEVVADYLCQLSADSRKTTSRGNTWRLMRHRTPPDTCGATTGRLRGRRNFHRAQDTVVVVSSTPTLGQAWAHTQSIADGAVCRGEPDIQPARAQRSAAINNVGIHDTRNDHRAQSTVVVITSTPTFPRTWTGTLS